MKLLKYILPLVVVGAFALPAEAHVFHRLRHRIHHHFHHCHSCLHASHHHCFRCWRMHDEEYGKGERTPHQKPGRPKGPVQKPDSPVQKGPVQKGPAQK